MTRDTLEWVKNRIRLKVIVNGDAKYPIPFKIAVDRYAVVSLATVKSRAILLGWDAEESFYTPPTIVKGKAKLQRKGITDRSRLDIQRVTSIKWTFIKERTYYEAH